MADTDLRSLTSQRPGFDVREVIAQAELLKRAIGEASYSVHLRLDLAQQYSLLGYPDLASGEAYKALLLVTELLDESGEYHKEAWDAARLTIKDTSGRERFAINQNEPRLQKYADADSTIDSEVDDGEVMAWALKIWGKHAYACVAEGLLNCGCLRSAFEFCDRGSREPLYKESMNEIRRRVVQQCQAHTERKGIKWDPDTLSVKGYPEKTTVRRVLYPWNYHEPDRLSEESLKILNEQLMKVAPKLEVRATELPTLAGNLVSRNRINGPGNPPANSLSVKQLGVFAREDISPGEVVLDEKSLLTASGQLHGSYCDACSAILPASKPSETRPSDNLIDPPPEECPDCSDVIFCSRNCFDLAQQVYHPAVCGKDIEAIAREDVPASQASDDLYSLLLLRVLAMAETQQVHPLDLPEVKYIWGDYHNEQIPATLSLSERDKDPFMGLPRTLPFSFRENVLLPIHMLEQLGVNVFATPNYDTWVTNTLYAKFRGTASARQGRDGRPEVGAVHPMWCLANHSCDPNVQWDWAGTMKFWVREERVSWKGRQGRKEPGLRKGEEVLNHYCDIDLDVKERREWAAGALGGLCKCKRCLWEETLEKEIAGSDQANT